MLLLLFAPCVACSAPTLVPYPQGAYERDFQWVWRLTGQTGSCMYMVRGGGGGYA